MSRNNGKDMAMNQNCRYMIVLLVFELKLFILNAFTFYLLVLTTHRLAYLCCQCDASLEMKLALGSVVARNER